MKMSDGVLPLKSKVCAEFNEEKEEREKENRGQTGGALMII